MATIIINVRNESEKKGSLGRYERRTNKEEEGIRNEEEEEETTNAKQCSPMTETKQ